MKRQLVLIKLGGSLITDKTKPFTALTDTIQFVAAEVAKVYKSRPNTDLLIGTGAGSYGHFTAHEYNLREGAHTAEQFKGMCSTHSGVRTLNAMVTDALLKESVPAFSMSPASFMTCKDGVQDQTTVEPLRILLANHCVPVVHGDTLCDSIRGTTIFSTEKVLTACLERLKGNYDTVTVIYAMRDEGILDASGQVIPELLPGHEVAVFGALDHDVTGGVLGKVQSARKALAHAGSAYILGGTKPNALLEAVEGHNVGTRVIGAET